MTAGTQVKYEGVWFFFCWVLFCLCFCFTSREKAVYKKEDSCSWIWFQGPKALGWRVTCRVILSYFTSIESAQLLCRKDICPLVRGRFLFCFTHLLDYIPSVSINTPLSSEQSVDLWVCLGSFVLSSPEDPFLGISISTRVPGLAWMPLVHEAYTPFQGPRFLFLLLSCGLVNSIYFCAPCCTVCSWGNKLEYSPWIYTKTYFYMVLCTHFVHTYYSFCLCAMRMVFGLWICDLWWPAWGQQIPLVGMYRSKLKSYFLVIRV